MIDILIGYLLPPSDPPALSLCFSQFQLSLLRQLSFFRLPRPTLFLHRGDIHANRETLLQSTIWTPITTRLVNDAITFTCWGGRDAIRGAQIVCCHEQQATLCILTDAGVESLLSNATLEEAGTAIAAHGAVMLTRTPVSAHGTAYVGIIGSVYFVRHVLMILHILHNH